MLKSLPADAYSLRLHREDPMKGMLLELHVHEDTEEGVAFLDHFRGTCFQHLGGAPMGRPIPTGADSVHWFLQGQSSSWLMFEFWTQDVAAVQRAVARVEDALRAEGLTVRLENLLPK